MNPTYINDIIITFLYALYKSCESLFIFENIGNVTF